MKKKKKKKDIAQLFLSHCSVIKNTPLRASSMLIKAEHNYMTHASICECRIIIIFGYRLFRMVYFVKLQIGTQQRTGTRNGHFAAVNC